MASAQHQEATRMKNIAICEALYLIDANLGVWTTKGQQDAAFVWLIGKRQLEKHEFGSSANNTSHDAGSLRTLVGRTVSKYQKASRGGGKKGVKDVFGLGSAMFPDEFLREIGFDNSKDTHLYAQAQAELSAAPDGDSEEIIETRVSETKADKEDPSIERKSPSVPLKRKAKNTVKPTVSRGSSSDVESADGQDERSKKPQQVVSRKRPRDGIARRVHQGFAGSSEASSELSEISESEDSGEPDGKRRKKARSNSVVFVEPPAQGGMAKGGNKRRRHDDDDDYVGTSGSKLHPPKRQMTKNSSGIPEVKVQPNVAMSGPVERRTEKTSSKDKKHAREPDSEPGVQDQLGGDGHKDKRPRLNVEEREITPSGSRLSQKLRSEESTDPLSVEASMQQEKNAFYTAQQNKPIYKRNQFHEAPSEVPRVKAQAEYVNPRPWGHTVESGMKKVLYDTQQAVEGYFRNHGFDPDRQADFVPHPSKELEELYQTFLGDDHWGDRVMELRERDHPPKIPASDALIGLIAAAVYRWVLLKTMPWDIERRFTEAFGSDIKHFESAIDDRGHDFELMRKHLIFKQICDKEFRKTTLKEYARKEADTLALILAPHLDRLTQGRALEDPIKRDWRESLLDVFVNAITIKQKIAATVPWDAVFEYIWPGNDEPFERGQMSAAHELRKPGDVVVTLMPGVKMTVHRIDGDLVSTAAQPVVFTLREGQSRKDPMTHEAYLALATFPEE